MNVAKQAGAQDCALFAIANLTTLAHGGNPTTEVYDQQEMRCHLINCFEKNKMEQFPLAKKRRPLNSVVDTVKINIFCTCRLPYKEDERMVGCDKCDEWYHIDCLSTPLQNLVREKENWFCEKCFLPKQ